MKLKPGKLYQVDALDAVWRADPERLSPKPINGYSKKLDTKEIFHGDVLLFLKQQNITIIEDKNNLIEVYAFLDKDGQELWLEKREIYNLEETKKQS